MNFKMLTYKERQELIKGAEDLLSKEKVAEEEYFNKLSCIRCGEKVYSILNSKHPFRSGRLIPNSLAKCTSCGVEFEPYTLIEVKLPIS